MAISIDDYLMDVPELPDPDSGRTLAEVFDAAVDAFGDAPVVLGHGEPRTWTEWRAESRALATGLQELGIGMGDVVAVHLPNSWQFLLTHVAVAELGAVLLPLHMAYGERDLLALLQRAQARLLVLPAARQTAQAVPLGSRLLRRVPSLTRVLTVGETGQELTASQPGSGISEFADLVRDHRGGSPQRVSLAPELPFVLLPSSGTVSGQPKLCLHEHGTLLANAAQVALDGRARPDDIIVSASPFTHLFGLLSVHLSLLTGSSQALLPRWDVDVFRALAERTAASVLFAVPAQLHDLAQRLHADPAAGRLRLREVRTGGAAVPGSLVSAVRRLTGAVTIVQWGMSEIGAGMVTRPEDPPEVAVASVGRPVSGNSARVADEAGRVCPDGQMGELQYRGPHLFRGYLGEPERTRAAVTEDGWLRTGDLATRNADGTFSLNGREAEVINVGGLKLSATEIEGLVSDLPQLAAAAVAGRPDDRLGQYPCLIATLRPGADMKLSTIRAHLAAKGVADYKLPLELILVDELPLTPSGKIARGQLAELVSRGSGQPRSESGRWREQLMSEPEPQRHVTSLGLVHERLARLVPAVAAANDTSELTFRELGVNSLGAVSLALELSAATGLRLPTTVVFDHPTPAALARHLVLLAAGASADQPDPATQRLAKLPASAGPGENPIVITGMSCRLPGGIDSPEDLWQALAEGRDTAGPFPADRGWDLGRLRHRDPNRPGRSSTHTGHFLASPAEFDASFFGISPREAMAMDPQQRLLLETAWEALERTGIDPTSLRDSSTGVFIGQMASDYAPRVTEAPEAFDGLLMTGNAASVASGRISYTLGLTGPALTVDTACSSSLVALHLAVQSLRRGECSLALAGGATVMATPASFVDFSRMGALAPDGHCKAFAAGADGAAWGEGVGVLVLERLADARRYGHPVLAVVAGSAVNQDGESNGLTAPRGLAQQQVLRLALADAGLGAHQVDVVEAHGTGTPLGDQIEAEALRTVYGEDRDAARPLWLGSVKSNVGHTQAAAGVSGVIKMILALRYGVLPRTLHADLPCAPLVADSAGPVRLLTRPRRWSRGDGIRCAGVSAFGISGTNAHVVLQEPPADPEPRADPEPAGEWPVPWVFSARSAAALRALATRLAPVVEAADPRQAGRALATSRAEFNHRAVIVASDSDGLRASLRTVVDGSPSEDTVIGTARPTGRTVFVFPGQGTQWAGMAADLLDESEVFARTLAACEQALAPHIDFSVSQVLRGAAGQPPLDRDEVTQCSLFAVMVALAGLWGSLGVRPDAVIGHSQGEIAAACVSGALSLEDAAQVVAGRAAAVSELAGGRMAAVGLSREELARHLPVFGDRLSLAVDNGPRSTVVSGGADAVAALLDDLGKRGVHTSTLAVDYASHRAEVAGIEDRLLRSLDGIHPQQAARVPFFSTVVPGPLDPAELTARYWYQNLRQPVQFQTAIHALLEAGHTTFIEISPHPVLIQPILETADAAGRTVTAVGTLRRGAGDRRRFLLSVAEAYTSGVPVSWRAAFTSRPSGQVELPCYPFQRERYWLSPGRGTSRPEAPAPASPEWPADQSATAVADEAELLALVLGHTALVLGHGDRTDIDADEAFAALGASSLAAVELSTRLARALGVPVPATAVLDHGTPRALTAYLWRLLRDRHRADGNAPPHEPLTTDELPGTLETLYRYACQTGHGDAAIELISAASRLRPTFTADAAAEHVPDPVRLGPAGSGPILVCFPSLLPTSGPHEYSRLADSLHGIRRVLVLPQPGFMADQPLPHDLEALTATHTAALDRHIGAAPFLLCGHSSGGLVAHAVAARLEELGRPADGLILLDSYWPDTALWTRLLPRLLSDTAITRQALAVSGVGTRRLTAAGGYLRLLTSWQPEAIRTQTLVLRARELVPDVTAHEWRLPHTRVDVPGDHFTMLTEHAATLADAISRWPDRPERNERP